MQRFFLIFLLLCGACSGVVSTDSQITNALDSGSDRNVEKDFGPPGSNVARRTNNRGSCSVSVAGDYVLETKEASGSAEFEEGADDSNEANSLEFDCRFKLGAVSYLFSIYDIVDAKQPGSNLGAGSFDVNDSADSQQDTSFDTGNNARTCNVELDAFAPTERKGMSAHFQCALTGNDGKINVTGSIALPPPTSDSVDPVVEGAGPPSCTVAFHGAYNGTAAMWGAVGPTGTYISCSGGNYSFEANTSGSAEFYIEGNSWCPTCSINFEKTSHACTITTLLDDGIIGGRFVADFSCTGLTAGDGTQIDIDGHVNGLRLAPPD